MWKNRILNAQLFILVPDHIVGSMQESYAYIVLSI